MTLLYVGGHYIGRLHESAGIMEEFIRSGYRVELRDEDGKPVATAIPAYEPLCPWEPTLTREEIDRRVARGGKPLSEVLKRLGEAESGRDTDPALPPPIIVTDRTSSGREPSE